MQQREEGRIAYSDGKKIMLNPYRANSVEWKRWRLGWLNAQRRDPAIERRMTPEAVKNFIAMADSGYTGPFNIATGKPL